jgi:hypothetical protein
MKKIISTFVFALAMLIAVPTFAQTKKVDRNSAEHKAWVENFRKKHDVKGKANKKKEAKKPAAKKQTKKAPAKKK